MFRELNFKIMIMAAGVAVGGWGLLVLVFIAFGGRG
jgi:hypothetical protein